VYGKPAPLTRTPDEPDCFSVLALDTVLWELTDDPGGDRYRFSVEVRHDDSGAASQVGLYFGHREYLPTGGPAQGAFYTLAFADRGARVRPGPDRRPTGYVELESRLFEVRPHGYVPSGPIERKAFHPEVRANDPGVWRKLWVLVSPDGVEARWAERPGKEEPVYSESGRELSQRLTDLQRSIPDELQAVPTDFRPRSGLGLYVSGGKASFRKAVVEPLTSGG
jgi:hypothetical protein